METALKHVGDECLKWPFATLKSGYATMYLDGRMTLVHRAVCERVHGPAPSADHEVAHSCGKGHEGCVSPAHVRWATHVENMADKIAHGTHRRGESNGGVKLTSAEVRRIRAMHGRVHPGKVAAMFGISRRHVNTIQRRVNWAWLD